MCIRDSLTAETFVANRAERRHKYSLLDSIGAIGKRAPFRSQHSTGDYGRPPLPPLPPRLPDTLDQSQPPETLHRHFPPADFAPSGGGIRLHGGELHAAPAAIRPAGAQTIRGPSSSPISSVDHICSMAFLL